MAQILVLSSYLVTSTPSGPGFFGCLKGGGGGGGRWRKVPAAHNSKTVHGIGSVIENHKLINLV